MSSLSESCSLSTLLFPGIKFPKELFDHKLSSQALCRGNRGGRDDEEEEWEVREESSVFYVANVDKC